MSLSSLSQSLIISFQNILFQFYFLLSVGFSKFRLKFTWIPCLLSYFLHKDHKISKSHLSKNCKLVSFMMMSQNNYFLRNFTLFQNSLHSILWNHQCEKKILMWNSLMSHDRSTVKNFLKNVLKVLVCSTYDPLLKIRWNDSKIDFFWRNNRMFLE